MAYTGKPRTKTMGKPLEVQWTPTLQGVQDPLGLLGIRYLRGSLDLLHTSSHSLRADI